jgi:hypothetical protein
MMKKLIILALILFANAAFANNWPSKHISNAVFAKSVVDRIPLEIITAADNSLKKIYFFTNIRNLTGDRITHRWLYKGKIKAEVSFDIKGKRWRVWSSKNIWHRWIGLWTVEVVDEYGEILLTQSINFTKKTSK